MKDKHRNQATREVLVKWKDKGEEENLWEDLYKRFWWWKNKGEEEKFVGRSVQVAEAVS